MPTRSVLPALPAAADAQAQVINGFRMPRSFLSKFKDNGGSGSDDEQKEPEAPKVFGKEVVDFPAQLPFSHRLLATDK